jgi:hypothetical protein
MNTNRLSFFYPDSLYCDYLREYDNRVPFNSGSKSTRPFIGVVFQINSFQYYAGLTSPKPKHQNMDDAIDFIKIDNGKLGAINLNLMIPIPSCLLTKVDINSVNSNYKILLQNQLSWCNELQNKNKIIKNSNNLYKILQNDTSNINPLRSRCCDFISLEKKCLEYCSDHNLNC